MDSAFVCLYDPEAVSRATEAGVGNSMELSMGGHLDPLQGPPLQAQVEVVSLHEGTFEEPEPRHGGRTAFDMGPTVVVRTEHGMTLMLTSRRIPPFSLRQLTSCGLDPKSFRRIVAKGVNAPLAAYAPVCDRIERVNTPGVTCADMTFFNFTHRRRPLFPFEPLP
jgi:microcystin degradation protein MlrC